MNVLTTNLCLLLVTCLTSTLSAESMLRLADGSTKKAILLSVESEWQVKFAIGGADEELVISAADVVAWGAPSEPVVGDLLLLADGGVIVGQLLSVGAGTAKIDTREFGEIALPMTRVRGIVFRLPPAGQQRDRFVRKARQLRPRSDQVWLSNGDTLDGAVLNVGADKIALRQGQRDVSLPIENVAAILFDAAAVAATRHAGLHAVLGFNDGSRLVADRCAMASRDGKAEIRSDKLTLSVAASKIVFIQPRGGSVTYLSDLEPASYRHIPLLELKWEYQSDANVLGGDLRCRGQQYQKGLGVHSASVLTYRVPEATKRLVGRIGIDDSAGGGGSAIFRVFVDDGSGKWQPRFASKVVRGDDVPRDISIDLGGARQVSLMVDFADRGDVLDHADWLDAAFVK